MLLFNISGRPPEVWPGAAFATFAIIYGGLFACVAGYVTARLAGSYLIQQSGASLWSLVSTILVSVPAAMLAGYLRHRSVMRPARFSRR